MGKLAAELEERERRAIERRIKDAHLPQIKTLDEFDFRQAPLVSPTRMSELAEGSYIERAEPIVFIGDSGTGKTHLVSALVVAACRQRKRARFITAAARIECPWCVRGGRCKVGLGEEGRRRHR